MVHFPKRRRTLTLPALANPLELRNQTLEAEPRASFRADPNPREEGSRGAVEQALNGMLALGHDLFVAGKVTEAQVVFEGILTQCPHAFAYAMLGIIHLTQGDVDRALIRFDDALRLKPNDLASLVYRAELRLTRKRKALALNDLQRAVKIGPSSNPFVKRARKLLVLARVDPSRVAEP